MLQAPRTGTTIWTSLIAVALTLTGTPSTFAHPGSGIVVDSQGHVYFVDTGLGVWRVNPQGELTLIHGRPYHWMAMDEKSRFAASHTLGDFDGGSFEPIAPGGAAPGLVISSDYPIVVGQDGGLYYVPFKRTGLRELVRRMPDGKKSVVAALPVDTSPERMQWVNGIAVGPDGSLYVTDNNAVRRIDAGGKVSTVRGDFDLRDCADSLPGAPGLPYLRGLAVARDGTIYVAANGCRSVISISTKGVVKTLFKAERPWSPTGVAIFGNDIYVLEYLHTPGDDRKEWVPRVRKITRDGKTSVVASVERQKK